MENLRDLAFFIKLADDAKNSSFPADYITTSEKTPHPPKYIVKQNQ